MAIVFLTDDALAASTSDDTAPTATFATSVLNVGSATVDVGAVQTGNGQSGGNQLLGSNSKGGINAGVSIRASASSSAWAAVAVGLMALMAGLR